MGIEVNIITENDYPEWDNYCNENQSAGLFHSIGWLKVVKKTYNHKPIYLIATNNGKTCGILPLFLVKSPFFGNVLASGIFTSYAGVCADNIEIAKLLHQKAAQIAVKNKTSYLEIKNIEEIDLGENWRLKSDYCTLILDIDRGSDEVWKTWRAKTRNDVRKAEKSGVKIESGLHLFDEFYQLVAEDMKRLGTPVHSQSFYKNILQTFPDQSNLFVAKLSGQPISAILVLEYKNIIQAYTSASSVNFRNIKPNALLYWNIIQHACDRGLSYLDFGRSTWESGTFKFKKHMGAMPAHLFYMYYLVSRKTIPEIHQDNRKYRLAIQVWQRLPLAVTKVIGPHMIKYVV